MFDKISRYRKTSNVTTLDSRGRLLASKDLRLLPEVTGAFRHTVESGDRLDQLAYKYYSQPLQWWNIADANAAFLSPLSLLPGDAVVVTRFPVSATGVPPWGDLLHSLQAVVGVEGVAVEEDVQLVLKQVTPTGGGPQIPALVEEFTRVVVITYNRRNVTAAMLNAAIAATGFNVGQPVVVDRVGREITIPPKPVG